MWSKRKRFIYTHARLIDRRLFEFHFEGGSKEAVLAALRAYRNADGGFGNGLEPDIRCPQSQPVGAEVALQIMDQIEGFDAETLRGISDYLRSITLPDGGLPLVSTSAMAYPHAPWWAADSDEVPSINPTGTVIGLLYKQRVLPGVAGEEWFERNVAYVWRYMAEGKFEHYHDAVQWIPFLENTPERERAAEAAKALDDWLARPGAIERDPLAEGYVQKALDWAPSPGSYARKFLTDDDVSRHLAVLIDQQREDGGWPISFEALSPAGQAEWRGSLTVNRLRTLRDYNVL